MSLQDLALRVELLERRQRRLASVAIASLVMLASIAVMAQTAPPPAVLSAQEFVVLDKSGAVKARLTVDDPKAVGSLAIRDPDGAPMVHVMRFTEGTAFFSVTRTDGGRGMSVLTDSVLGTAFNVFPGTGDRNAALSFLASQEGSDFWVKGPQERATLRMLAGLSTAALSVNDSDGLFCRGWQRWSQDECYGGREHHFGGGSCAP